MGKYLGMHSILTRAADCVRQNSIGVKIFTMRLDYQAQQYGKFLMAGKIVTTKQSMPWRQLSIKTLRNFMNKSKPKLKFKKDSIGYYNAIQDIAIDVLIAEILRLSEYCIKTPSELKVSLIKKIKELYDQTKI